jgi:hypothetical protein
MPHSTPTPDPATDSVAGAPATGLWIPVTHQLVRRHDGSVISSHCCATCGAHALEDLTPARMIGPNSPGPFERVWVDLIDVATGDSVEFTGTLTPIKQ